MGAKASSLANLNNNENLFQLCGSQKLSVNAPEWNQLFSFGIQIPLTRYYRNIKLVYIDEI